MKEQRTKLGHTLQRFQLVWPVKFIIIGLSFTHAG